MTLDARIQRFAPVDITADLTTLRASDRQALVPLIRAARHIDGLFLDQVWSGNQALLLQLAADVSPEAAAELRYFVMNKGPWSRLDDNAVFVRPTFAVPTKPPQANFYPSDATKDEVDAWFRSRTGAEAADATGFFSVIRRQRDGRLSATPYSTAYQPGLLAVAGELRAAAAATESLSLRRFLTTRADALLTDDYYASDLAWMELDAAIEPTIGPYETYEDEWFGYKAAFEAFIALRDDAETRKLADFGPELQGIELALPIDTRYRNPSLGTLAPIRVVNLIFSAGDGNRGVQTAAFNLPNDERIVREKGAKRVMFRNVQAAKFARVLQPIAAIALAPSDAARVSFDAFFTHILMHELMHGLGPHQVHGSGSPVRLVLQDTYAAIEEAKADISGLWALQYLADKGFLPQTIEASMYVTFLASTFRSLRFGLNEAHGMGMAVQLNSLLDAGAVVIHADGTFAVVTDRFRAATRELTGRIMTMQAEGDYAGTRAWLDAHVTLRPEVQRVIDRIRHIPVDIAPNFVTAETLTGGT